MDNEKICKNGTVFSTLCTSKNYEKNQNVKSQLTKECKGLKDHHEIGYLEIQGNNIEMHSENVCQDSNADFLNLCEDYNRNILQCNPVANSQVRFNNFLAYLSKLTFVIKNCCLRYL